MDLERGLARSHALLEDFSEWPELGFGSQSERDELLLAARLEDLLGVPREAPSLSPRLLPPPGFLRGREV